MKKMLFLALLLSVFVSAFAKNLGHRAAGGKREYFKSLPENSISSMRAALEGTDGSIPLQFHKDFVYLEFDIQETYDGKVVVFHDKWLGRLIPKRGKNLFVYNRFLGNGEILNRMSPLERIFNKLEVKHLTLAELKQFDLMGMSGEKIPTLRQMLDSAIEFGIKKPVAVEVKYLRTTAAKLRVIELVSQFKRSVDNVDTIFESEYDMEDKAVLFAFKSKFKKTYGQHWCKRIMRAGLNFFQTITHFKLC